MDSLALVLNVLLRRAVHVAPRVRMGVGIQVIEVIVEIVLGLTLTKGKHLVVSRSLADRAELRLLGREDVVELFQGLLGRNIITRTISQLLIEGCVQIIPCCI